MVRFTHPTSGRAECTGGRWAGWWRSQFSGNRRSREMFFHLSRQVWAAGAVCLLALGGGNVQSQTLPVAGNPRQAAEQDRAQRSALQGSALQERDGIRGVREQDNA